jgi:hypothetical protein
LKRIFFQPLLEVFFSEHQIAIQDCGSYRVPPQRECAARI